MQFTTRFAQIVKRKSKDTKWLAICLATAGLISFLSTTHTSTSVATTNEPSPSADTFIPKGFVLIPIEIANLDSVDAMIGSFGVVDIYSPNQENIKKPIRIASQVKLIRAPNNPNQFAVLIPETESSQIVSQTGPFIVVIQNPQKNSSQFLKKNKKERRLIIEE